MDLRSILDKAEGLLQGEPARFIGYGAGLVVYAVAKVSGAIPDVPLETALTGTAAYVVVVGAVVETIRKFVYSPMSAADLLAVIEELQSDLADAQAAPTPPAPEADAPPAVEADPVDAGADAPVEDTNTET